MAWMYPAFLSQKHYITEQSIISNVPDNILLRAQKMLSFWIDIYSVLNCEGSGSIVVSFILGFSVILVSKSLELKYHTVE